MATVGKARMAVNDASLIGWKPRKWAKSERRMWNGHGRRKPKGRAATKSAVTLRRNALHRAARRHG